MVIPLPKLPATDLPGVTPVVAGFVVAGVVVLLAVAAEAIHFRRVLRAAPLAFGPRRAGFVLASIAPVLRVLALGCAAWGLMVLLTLAPKSYKTGEIKESEYRHLVLVLDISRSMSAEDAGPSGKQKRSERAADLIQSFFERVQPSTYKTTSSRCQRPPVVVDTTDREVIRNILPSSHAARLQGGRRTCSPAWEAAKSPSPGPEQRGADGRHRRRHRPLDRHAEDAVSIGNNVVMVGVGNPSVGKSFGGHMSRRTSRPRQVATRLNGTPRREREHLTTELVSKIDERRAEGRGQVDAAEYALLCVGARACWHFCRRCSS